MRSSRFLAVAAVLFLAPLRLLAQCGVPTAYTINPSATGTVNWTNTTTVWIPGGGYPGCTAGDSATIIPLPPTPPTLVINGTIPNPLIGLNNSMAGALIDIQAGGSLTLAGGGSITNGAKIQVNGGSLTIANGGSLSVDASSFFYLESGSIDVQTGGQLTLGGTNTIDPSGTLQINGGTMTLSSTLSNGGAIALNGATIDGAGTLNNSGAIGQVGASSTISAVLNNIAGATGVDVSSATLQINGGGTGDAPFTIAGGATLEFPTGSYTLGTGGTVSGAGTLAVSGATLSIGGVTSPTNFSMSGGTLTGAGFLSVAGNFDWNGGTLTGSGGTEIAGTGFGYFGGGFGTMYLDGRSFNDYGTVYFSTTTNPLELSNGATFSVFGNFDIQDDGSVTCNCSTPSYFLVSPNGVLAKSGGSGTSSITPLFTNDYQVYALSGTLEIDGDGTHNGFFYSASGATLRFAASNTVITASGFLGTDGDVDFTGSTTINSGFSIFGLMSIDGGSVYAAQPSDTTDFLLVNGGNFQLGSDFTMYGNGTWSSGTISGGGIGRFYVDSGATMTLDAATCVPTLQSVEFVNNGLVNYTPTAASTHHLQLSGATITNNGTFDMQADAPITVFSLSSLANASGCGASAASRKQVRSDGLIVSPSFITNNATWQKTGANTSDIEPSFTNNGTVLAQAGTINFVGGFTQSGGVTTLGAGNVQSATPMTFNGGALDGSGSVSADVQNNGATVAPGGTSNGTIIVNGNYTQASGGALSVGITSSAIGGFDQLVVQNAATLDGTMTATLSYTPTIGDTWPVLTYASRTGSFATENLPPQVTSSYTPTAYVLQAVAPSADLSAGMTGPATVNAGAALSYDVTITNNGPSSTSGTITVVDTLPAGATSASGSGTGWTCGAPSGGTITCTSTATIANTASFPTLTFAMTAPVNGGGVTNSATVSSSYDSNATNDTASVGTTVTATADLQVVKTGPNGVIAGQNITWTITVTNNGPSSASNVVVSDPDPANTTFVSNSGGCTNPYPCNLGILTAGQVVTINSTYSTSPSFSGNVTNTATVSSTTFDPNNANDSSTKVTNVGAQADLQITKTGPASTTPNQTITYTINYTNNGPSPATSVVISDPTPPGIAWVSNSGACVTAFPCSIGTVNAGQSGTITAMFFVPSNYTGTSISNTASILSPVNDPTTGNNSSTVVTNVAQTADVAVTKTGPPSASPGGNVVYTITVTNNGPSSAGSVVVSDTTPAGLTFSSNSGACVTPYPCNLGTLTSGQSVTITTTYSVPSNYSGPSITNTASVTSGASDSNGANNNSTVVTPVLSQADLAITKSGPTAFTPGANIVYTINVTNNGPLDALNVFVTDTAPAGVNFVSNSGACTTPFPCSLGAILNGQTKTITATFNVSPGYASSSLTNTANVSTSTFETNLANNSSSTTANATPSTGADVSITKTGPGAAHQFEDITFTIVVTNNGPSTASNIVVSDPTPSGSVWLSNSGACTTAFPCNIGTLAPAATATINATYRVASAGGQITNTATVTSTPTDTNTANNSATAVVGTGPVFNCPTQGPALGAPLGGAVVSSPVNFTWGSVANAIGYTLTIVPGNGGAPIVINTGTTSASVPLPAGAYSWSVSAAGVESCRPISSGVSSFLICSTLLNPPLASVIGESTTGQTHTVQWTSVDGATNYELQEALSPTFAGATTFTLNETGKSFTKNVTAPTAFWYRVRAVASCNPNPGPYSPSVAVVVVPVPQPPNHDPNVNVPDGSHTPVTWQIFVPGLPGQSSAFIATVDRPWLTVSPTSGIIPPEGMNFTISVDPSGLTNGTWTGTLIVVFGTNAIGEPVASDGTTTVSIPVSISLVTPVTPQPLTAATNSAMIVPSVGHLAGIESLWRSDIRLANLASNAQKFQLTFNAGTGDTAATMKQTTVSVDAGATMALDDIVRNWYGIGGLGNSSNGLLTVQPLDAAGKPLTTLSAASAVSSRTFNASGDGTVGQFIPAVPFAKFIGRGGTSALSIQQLAQSSAYRTNLGIVEAAGKQASVLVSAFNGTGTKLFDLPLTLQAGEQKQLNSFLAANGVTSLSNGRVEVRVTGGDGKVTAYASVVDNTSNDPLLINGTSIDGIGATRFVVPGIADISGGGANWRSDMRVFNAGNAPQNATLTFYPSASGAPVTAQVSIAPGEIKQLDDVLHTTLGVTNLGGALHVTTNTAAPLVVTARTYDQTANGTLGQFIPAVTAADAVGLNERSLQILQAEESTRYRTNIGIVEVNGKAATAEITVTLPNSKVTPVIQVPLGAFESKQIPVLSSLGLGSVYNARVTVRVTDGDGRVTAYGSVIDNVTKDPTFIPAQ